MNTVNENVVEKEDEGLTVELPEDNVEEVVETQQQENGEQTRTNVQDDEEDLQAYSENVKKRINKLTAQRKQASEEAEAAVQWAKTVQEENNNLRQKLNTLDQGYLNEFESRVTSQIAQTKKVMAEAHEAGDMEKVAEAQSILAKLAVQEEELGKQKRRQEASQQEVAQQAQQPVQQQPQAQPKAPDIKNDTNLQGWMQKNNWFMKDTILTNAAQGVHQQLVAEGFYPDDNGFMGQDYYNELDKRLKSYFPNREEFGDVKQEQKSNVQAVTPASNTGRSVKSGRKKSVELTKGQVALAKKLNIPLEKYAQEVMKIESRRS
jgi:hypothetical protein|tara:strand:+ start:635 stop:1594 length:960 start_codon:yes stop_codon:yes gene_type:complete